MDASKSPNTQSNIENIRNFFESIYVLVQKAEIQSDPEKANEYYTQIDEALFKKGDLAQLLGSIKKAQHPDVPREKTKKNIEDILSGLGISYDDFYSEMMLFKKKIEYLRQVAANEDADSQASEEPDPSESGLTLLFDKIVQIKTMLNPTLVWIYTDRDSKDYIAFSKTFRDLLDVLSNPAGGHQALKAKVDELGTSFVGLKDTLCEMQLFDFSEDFEIENGIAALNKLISREKAKKLSWILEAEITDHPSQYEYTPALNDFLVDKMSLLLSQAYFAAKLDDPSAQYYGEEWKAFASQCFSLEDTRSDAYQMLATPEHINDFDWVHDFISSDDAEENFHKLEKIDILRIMEYFEAYDHYVKFHHDHPDITPPRQLPEKELAIRRLCLKKILEKPEAALKEIELLLNQFRFYVPIESKVFKTIKQLRSDMDAILKEPQKNQKRKINQLKEYITALEHYVSALWDRAEALSDQKAQKEYDSYHTNYQDCTALFALLKDNLMHNPLDNAFKAPEQMDFFKADLFFEQSLILAQCVLHHEKTHFGELYFDVNRLLDRFFSQDFKQNGEFHPVFIKIAESLYKTEGLTVDQLGRLSDRIQQLFDIAIPSNLERTRSIATGGHSRRMLFKTYLEKAASLQQRKKVLPVLYGKSQKTFKQKETESSYDPVLLAMIDSHIQKYVDSFYHLSWKKALKKEENDSFCRNLSFLLEQREGWLHKSGVGNHALHPSIRLQNDFRGFSFEYRYSQRAKHFTFKIKRPKWAPDSLEGCYYRLHELLVALKMLYRIIVSKLPYLSDYASGAILAPHQNMLFVKYPSPKNSDEPPLPSANRKNPNAFQQ